jgi:hypothetical protein
MATDKQISANRANPKRSTGPKTAVGRSKSSRNAFRHGLSCRRRTWRPRRRSTLWRVRWWAQGADEEKLMAASELAEAQMELLRIRAVRARMLAAVDLASGVPQELGRWAGPLRAFRAHQAQTGLVQALR